MHKQFFQACVVTATGARRWEGRVPRTAGGPRDLLVYTFWSDHLRQDLRHELTHALLNGVTKEVPLWLDEGLAEYYELPPERDGMNAGHLQAFRKGEVTANLVYERVNKKLANVKATILVLLLISKTMTQISWILFGLASKVLVPEPPRRSCG